jgi:hypothetical protein
MRFGSGLRWGRGRGLIFLSYTVYITYLKKVCLTLPLKPTYSIIGSPIFLVYGNFAACINKYYSKFGETTWKVNNRLLAAGGLYLTDR